MLEWPRARLSCAFRPDRVIRETVNEMVGRLFGGETMPLMRHLIEQNAMSRDDIENSPVGRPDEEGER